MTKGDKPEDYEIIGNIRKTLPIELKRLWAKRDAMLKVAEKMKEPKKDACALWAIAQRAQDEIPSKEYWKQKREIEALAYNKSRSSIWGKLKRFLLEVSE
ncbi:MAG: hypothetical protein ACE5HX_19385 [bacterium]